MAAPVQPASPLSVRVARIALVVSLGVASLIGCSSMGTSDDPMSNGGVAGPNGDHGSYGADTGSGYPGHSSDAGTSAADSAGGGGGSFGNVGTGGGQDFAAFRRALDEARIPDVQTLDANGFFAEHFTELPAPDCGKTFCLHGLLSISEDLARGGNWTLLQMGMNSPIDPATVKKPALDIAVVIDRSGSMAGDDKIGWAKKGVDLLIEQLGADDTLTVVAFDDVIETIYGPAKVTDKPALEAKVDLLYARGSTDIYGALDTAYQAVLKAGDETQQRRVIFLTDGQPTAGYTDPVVIAKMSAAYNERYVGLTTIALGADADVPLLRNMAETGGGNAYYVENPAAVTEVFTEELGFFAAPIAYDLDLTFTEPAYFGVKELFGTNLWASSSTGGKVHIPSVFLVSRTSTAPGPSGGRRGGGSAIIAQLGSKTASFPTPCPMGDLHLRYRLPGSTTYETQDVPVAYDGDPLVPPAGGYFSAKPIEKNTVILDFFVALRDTTKLGQTDRGAAKAFLASFQSKIAPRLVGNTDEDLQDDLKIVQRYLDVLAGTATPITTATADAGVGGG
jgi:Ca-activated chloride channel family protein